MVHVRVRNRFATDSDGEPEAGERGREDLEEDLASDLQQVLAALRRSAYAPPLRLVSLDEFRKAETQPESVENESASSDADEGTSDRGPNSHGAAPRKRARRKRIAVYVPAATAALGLLLISQQWLGLAEHVANAEAAASRTAARVIETAPVGLLILVELAAAPLRGWIDDPRELTQSSPPRTSVDATRQTIPPARLTTSPVLAKPTSQPPAELRRTAVPVVSAPPAPATPLNDELAQSSVPSPVELQASNRPAERQAELVGSPALLRPSLSAADATPPMSVQPSPELSAIRQPVLANSAQVAAAGGSNQSAVLRESGLPQTTVRGTIPPPVTRSFQSTVNTAVNLRSGPDNSASVVAVVPQGSRVSVTSCKFWCEIVYDGKRGWVYNEFVDGVRRPPTRPVVAGVPKRVEPERRCDRSGRMTFGKFIRQGFVGGDETGSTGTSGDRC